MFLYMQLRITLTHKLIRYVIIEYQMLLNTYYYNINYFIRSLMCLVYNRKYFILSIHYKLLEIVHVSKITWKTVYVTIQSHVTHVVSGSSVHYLITCAIYHIAVIVHGK